MSVKFSRLNNIAILFDLDGTLVDSAPDLIHTLNITLSAHQIPPVDEDIARPIISLGARNMLQTGIEQAGYEPKEAFLDQLLSEFLEYYGRNIAVHSQPFEGVKDILEDLTRQGASLGVCTNKTQTMAEQLLEELDLAGYFQAIAGRDRFDVFKPNPAHLIKTAELMQIPPHTTIMVGDSQTDIETAKAAQVPVIAASFGYETQPIGDFSPDTIFHHYKDFPAAMESVLPKLTLGPVDS